MKRDVKLLIIHIFTPNHKSGEGINGKLKTHIKGWQKSPNDLYIIEKCIISDNPKLKLKAEASFIINITKGVVEKNRGNEPVEELYRYYVNQYSNMITDFIKKYRMDEVLERAIIQSKEKNIDIEHVSGDFKEITENDIDNIVNEIKNDIKNYKITNINNIDIKMLMNNIPNKLKEQGFNYNEPSIIEKIMIKISDG